MSRLLTLESVDVELGGAQILRGIDLTLDAGELVAIMGRSGSGKSTLLNVAGGLVEASRGTVTVAGQTLRGCSARSLARVRRTSVGYVFQDFNLVTSLTALENVSLPMELDDLPLDEAERDALDALASVGLEGKGVRFPDELSGGERQRVAIARGLVAQRSLLLADEPTASLDDLTAESIMSLLRRQCDRGAGALVVTHDPAQAAWADRVIRLREGRVDSVSTGAAPTSIAGLLS